MDTKVLVVEDQWELRSLICNLLQNKGYVVTEANNGQEALQALKLRTFDLVISDIRMPVLNGLKLLSELRKFSDVPFIFLTAYTDVRETPEALELGANGYLAKPFDEGDLFQVIAFSLDRNNTKKSNSQDHDFCKVGIEDFVSGTKMVVDLYARISEERYVCIAKKGSNVSLEHIRILRSKDVRSLYIRKEDFSSYVGFNLEVARALETNQTISMDRKERFLAHVSEIIQQHLHLNGINQRSFDYAKAFLENSVSIITEVSSASELIATLSQERDPLHTHSLAVSLYSVILAKHLKQFNSQEIFHLALGALFHDIGKRTLDPVVFAKDPSRHTCEDLEMMKQHPFRGAQLLMGVKLLASEIYEIVLQHHENNQGTGYPGGLTADNINPLAKIVALVDQFCNLTLRHPGSDNDLVSAKTAVAMLEPKAALFEPGLLSALRECFA